MRLLPKPPTRATKRNPDAALVISARLDTLHRGKNIRCFMTTHRRVRAHTDFTVAILYVWFLLSLVLHSSLYITLCCSILTIYIRHTYSVTKNSRRKGSAVRIHCVIDEQLHLCLEHFALALSKWFHKLWNWSIRHSCLCLSSFSPCIISLRWVFFPPQCTDKPDILFTITSLSPTCLLKVKYEYDIFAREVD